MSKKLRFKTYTNVRTDKGRTLDVAIMDQYGRIFQVTTDDKGRTTHVPTGECGSANH